MISEKRKRSIKDFLRDKFNLDADKASQEEVVESIRKGVDFKGTNLWILIFATFIASLGLNINSTAVIIGAMLISPLMGPIMGIGLSLGINDFELMKRSVKNFGFMIAISILTSTVYFLISPISTAQSELLARTSPTLYDVLIAFFGGLAGIVAQSRKDRTSTVIPGVAIATALMPPLCTAGYGLATGQFNFFMGAFYLFMINTVFIAFATFLLIRFLKYHKKVFLDKKRETQVTRYMAIILFALMIPSVIIGYRLIKESIFENNADRFIRRAVVFENSQVISAKKEYSRKSECVIELLVIGEPISDDAKTLLTAQLPDYNLENTRLIIRQPGSQDKGNLSLLETNISRIIDEKNHQISQLETQLRQYTVDTIPAAEITREMSAISDLIEQVTLSKSAVYSMSGEPVDTVLMCFVKLKGREIDPEREKIIIDWLKVRTKTDNVKLYIK